MGDTRNIVSGNATSAIGDTAIANYLLWFGMNGWFSRDDDGSFKQPGSSQSFFKGTPGNHDSGPCRGTCLFTEAQGTMTDYGP